MEEKKSEVAEMPRFCQSCGMPLTNVSDCGTNADGSLSDEYCKYCYQSGTFTRDCTMEEMIGFCADFVGEYNRHAEKPLTRDEYRQMLQGFFPMLKRWKK